MVRGARVAVAGLLLLSAGCTATRVTRGGGESIAQAQALPASGVRHRIAVGHIIDKTANGELTRQLERVNLGREPGQRMLPAAITGGVRDMLITELFGSGGFIVVERESLNALLIEQEFSQSASVGDRTRLPLGQLEGAELLVVGAITSFDAGADGMALPIPIPIGDDGHFGILRLRAKRGHVAMDLRLIDCRTGRVVGSTAVEGSNLRFGVDFTGYFDLGGWDYLEIPNLLAFFRNTPVEKALQDMVTAAIAEISAKAAP